MTHFAVIGVGVSTAAGAGEVGALLDAVLREGDVRPGAVWCVATAEGRGGEPAVRAAARVRGLPLVAYPVPVLAQVKVPNPSDAVRSRTGTPSVAEAAALHAARTFGGVPARLAVPKRASRHSTAALATTAVPAPAVPAAAGLRAPIVLGPPAVAPAGRAPAVRCSAGDGAGRDERDDRDGLRASRHNGAEAVKPWYFLPERHAPGDGDSEDCP
ncbi:cobalamin biosynthesis protein [Actinomadura algeriensis]|uniref:Cobalt-precorrin 5A hydrolase/precorrin-3B C17-methyltransferase n=1 Tax=Actinomadura algeriensis TaxID=1679523 RepID=A0ABR9JID5_9ACTN|nr:cobalamin biosynthesis protein [Actinomadura algeriensis]MBE1530312.1 cobalt-precorrin 5A hydrolase/precorrin-3B C17-methyltransferase [Actinomadura algeriensis]